jgi:hypothetical protein
MNASFELYKLLVEEVREARRARRELSNAFLTLNLGGVGALGYLARGEIGALKDPALLIWFCAALAFTCWIWRTSNSYYTHLLRAKYAILDEVEAKLEAQPIKDEWERLRPHKPRRAFSLEYAMPTLFGIGYLVVMAYLIDWRGLEQMALAAWAELQALSGR